MSVALLFPGQGVQHPEALRWLEDEPRAAPALAAMATRLGADWRQRLADPEWATRNAVAQVLVTGLSLAAWAALAPSLPPVVAVAGYSVGELAATAAAGAYDVDEALWLAVRRAERMDAASAARPGGMIAGTGVSEADVAALCRSLELAPALHLAPDKWVLGGPVEAVREAGPRLEALGARITCLQVRVASHVPAMAPAAAAFAADLRDRAWQRARMPLVRDLDGRAVREPEALKAGLAGQLAATVQWDRAMSTLRERRPLAVLEVGPGQALAKLWNERGTGVPARSADEFGSAAAVAGWVRAAVAGG